ncbi:MAG TPA: glycoside hydrolase family 2 TIM barrel-domain containing protein [Nocardioidaceae bacterium]|nr:glycoside hydrolase family 2 TIM barrel-domain containing protein [Nocardioidaceae bacterium]
MTDPHLPRASDDYPRPMLVRGRWRSLDGDWQFGYDDDDRGVVDGWHEPDRTAPFDRVITVPFPPESPASGVGDTGFHPIVWYRRTIAAGDLHDGPLGDDRLLIHFGAVDHSATVWFDGVFVGAHVGGQTPFWVDVADLMRSAAAGASHVIVVRAEEDPRDRSLLRGKQDWKLEPHGIWYHRSTGIWQTVWAEPAPRQRIADVSWTPDLNTASVAFEVELAAWPEHPLDVEVALTLGGDEVARASFEVEGRSARHTIRVTGLESSASRGRLLWSPDQPTLIDADVVLRERGRDASELDRVASYLGLRSVGVAEGQFLLNGEATYVRAVLDQGYRADTHLANRGSDALRREVELVRELGFNTVRMHQKAEDPRFLSWADRLGVMVWGETANAHEFTPRSVELLTAEWTALVRRDRSHPSIVAWVPINESWGVDEIGTEPTQQAFAMSITALTRALDPSRPVMSNEGWHHVDSDIVGVHDYASKTAVILDRYGDLAAVHQTLAGPGPAKRKLILNARQRERFDRGEAPLMLTEFGGVGYAGERSKSWGYSTVSSDDQYESLLRALFDAVRSCKPVAGYCYTQFMDCAQEANGLLREDGTPKLPVDAIRRIVLGA